MAASGGSWVKVGAGTPTGKLVFVNPAGRVPPLEGAKAPTRPTRPGLPDSLEELTLVKSLGGSTGAKLVQDAQGNLYVQKKGNSPEHLKEEAHADAAYRALGLDVPEFKVFDTPGGPVKLARFHQGKALEQVINRGGGQEAIGKIARGFAADALLGNWDVIGLSQDNILISKSGRAYRIDNGGSLRFRAQGAPKGKAWNEYPTELWTLRTSDQGKPIFGHLTMGQISQQIKALEPKRPALLRALPKELRRTVGARLNNMLKVAGQYDTLKAQGKSDAEIDKTLNQTVKSWASGG